MGSQSGRNSAGRPPIIAEGWSLRRLTPPSRLFGANGLSTGPDGRIYVAQVCGSQISAIDIETGATETVSPWGGGIVGPDDLAFDPAGNIYATEITEGRVSMRAPNGTTRVVYGDIPAANPITFYRDRLIAGECRMGGRIMELDRNGGPPRVLAADLPMPNAMQVGPDGKLYFPVMGANEIWRIGLEGGTPERVAGNLGVPDSVKFDPRGYIVSTQVRSGQVLRIDPRTGEHTVLANLTMGLDNSTFVGNRLFVSNICGYVVEVLPNRRIRELVPEGLTWPLGLARGDDGVLFIADGTLCHTLRPGAKREIATRLFTPNYPGSVRGVSAMGSGEYVLTTTQGEIVRFWPGEQRKEVIGGGFDQLYGVAAVPGGAIVVAEMGTGRALQIRSGEVEELATGLDKPSGVAVGTDGACFVAESGAGRVVRLRSGRTETVLDGLEEPQGILVRGGVLYAVDVGARELLEYDPTSGKRRTLVAGLPIGAPDGIHPRIFAGVRSLSGPQGPFAGIASSPDGTLYVSGDAEGSVLAVHPA